MKPASAIAMLDRQIARHGQTVVLRRISVDANPIEATVRATKRDYRPQEITDGIVMGTSQVILSPTSLKGTPFEAEVNWPRKSDRVIIDGRERIVEAPDPIKIDDVLVRFNLTVAG